MWGGRETVPHFFCLQNLRVGVNSKGAFVEKIYQIVFYGEISEQISRAEARENIARLFKGNSRPTPDLFTGNRHILKGRLDSQSAFQYLELLQREGLVCRLEEVAGEGTETAGLALESEKIVCPNCRERQVKHVECSKCGIIFGKWERRPEGDSPPLVPVCRKPPVQDAKRSIAEWLKLAVLMPLLVILGFCIYKTEGWDQLHYPAGALVTSSPQQMKLDTPKYFKKDGVSYTFSDKYHLQARVIKKEGFIMDLFRISDPVVYLGWGPMSDEAILKTTEFLPGRVQFNSQPLVPVDLLMACFLKAQIIPASEDVEKFVKKLRVGEVVEVGGYLLGGG